MLTLHTLPVCPDTCDVCYGGTTGVLINSTLDCKYGAACLLSVMTVIIFLPPLSLLDINGCRLVPRIV